MVRVRLYVRNTHFIVRIIDASLNHILDTIDEKLSTYTFMWDHRLKRNIMRKDKVYYTYVPHTKEYRYHINMLKDFILTVGHERVSKDEISIQYDREYHTLPIDLEMREGFVPREKQKKYIAALLDKSTGHNKLIDLRTGAGKGFVSIYTMLKLNMKTCILVLPQFMVKWEEELVEYVDMDYEDIYKVQGGDSLKTLMSLDKPHHSVFIFSVRTISNYIKSYIEDPTSYPVSPQDLFMHLGIGTLINDESHMQTHAIFTALMFFNPKRFIGLSATFDTNQRDLKRIYQLHFPDKYRISNLVKFENYIHTIAVRYKLQSLRNIQFKLPQGYNHNIFEQSIMRNSVLLKSYLELIHHYVKIGYYNRKQTGEKLLIYMASVRMCSIVTNYFNEIYEELDVRRYVEDDPYENILEADISVSTIGSAGTGLDIKKLLTVINTVSIKSLQANIQAQGRLREIPGREVRYYYIYSKDIPNQVKAHLDRHTATKKLTKTYYMTEHDKTINTY